MKLRLITGGMPCLVALLLAGWGSGCRRQSATAAKNAPDQTPADVAPALTFSPMDFSQSNSAGIFFGEQDEPVGLTLHEGERDGLSTGVRLGAVPCRGLNPVPKERAESYLYFSLDRDFKTRPLRYCRIDVEYFDGSESNRPVTFWVQYDASGFPGPNPRYANAGPGVSLKGSNVWRTATFRIRNGTFANGQNGGADFRLTVRPPEFYVRRVTLTREALPPRPAPTPAR